MSMGWRFCGGTTKAQCAGGHSMKHFRIIKVSLFDDDRGGPASSEIEIIERKCTRCGELAEVEFNRYDSD